jgi:hypothetical protein
MEDEPKRSSHMPGVDVMSEDAVGGAKYGGGLRHLTLRGLAELVVVIVGVVLGLAVDRWVAGIDDRAAVTALSHQLREDLRRDSTAMMQLAQMFERRAESGMDLLRVVEDAQATVTDPSATVAGMEWIGWFTPFNPSRATWDEIVATGRLGLFEDQEIRSALTEYYSALDRLADLETQWVAVFQDYWERQQAVVPPLIRFSILDADFGIAASTGVSKADAERFVTAYRGDPALRGALGTAVGVYRYAGPVFDEVFLRLHSARVALDGS